MFKFNWISFLVLVVFAHLGLLYILFFGSPAQALVSFVIFFLECMFCSTAIYHRLLSHRSWIAPRWVEIAGTFVGIFTFTGTPITRTLSHRYHHKFTETALDPHSPKVIGIFKTYLPMLQKNKKMDLRYVEDIIKDPFHRWCHSYYLQIIIGAFLLSATVLGFNWAVSLFVAPGALCWMNISICNIFCHLGQEQAIVNSRFLSILTFGEGWHLYHHDHPTTANFGGGNLDLGYLAVRIMQVKAKVTNE